MVKVNSKGMQVSRKNQKKTATVKITIPREPSVKELSLPSVLQALSDEVRLEIVLEIYREGELACGEFSCSMPKSTLSHHFRVLREAGVLATRREGKEWINSIRVKDLNARFPGLLDAVLTAAARKK
jgi:DNA-binding transcriptional ArsR family regulator